MSDINIYLCVFNYNWKIKYYFDFFNNNTKEQICINIIIYYKKIQRNKVKINHLFFKKDKNEREKKTQESLRERKYIYLIIMIISHNKIKTFLIFKLNRNQKKKYLRANGIDQRDREKRMIERKTQS